MGPFSLHGGCWYKGTNQLVRFQLLSSHISISCSSSHFALCIYSCTPKSAYPTTGRQLVLNRQDHQLKNRSTNREGFRQTYLHSMKKPYNLILLSVDSQAMEMLFPVVQCPADWQLSSNVLRGFKRCLSFYRWHCTQGGQPQLVLVPSNQG